MAAVVALLTLILGLLLGFYGRAMYDRLSQLYAEFQDRREAKQVGVVRIQGVPSQPIDLTSETGSVMRPTPSRVEDQRQEERARILREGHQ